ncbi:MULTISPECIES: hypothetical protein [Mesorhizobium]|uniref:Uncharacterized protein n=1 Tax=Mesorhizobium ventifaucium TaxID=666020 RepID=A0ABN8JND7_9HYPH|nr:MULTISPECIES: hypothetical protein [Mesorhizobium]TIN36829.1 MAG: hypothetical protein E5Y13_22740 [Mesorhizobium sp.]TJU73567.1 MAG: hypothetical protein E5Y15_32650 [Mesorhizobium sp.]TJU86674.1 MAG: hypothetical protein E5Y10_22130 [Mesorhizobium sp.]CAH2399178.1 conserved hypothetical protein [Mesorhizobium ventifaucium]
MNGVNARSVPVYGGFQGEFRKVHRSEWEPVQVNGVAQLYDTADAAEVAAWRALLAHLQGDIVGSGDRASIERTKAEERFGKIFPGHGKKPVVVERR